MTSQGRIKIDPIEGRLSAISDEIREYTRLSKAPVPKPSYAVNHSLLGMFKYQHMPVSRKIADSLERFMHEAGVAAVIDRSESLGPAAHIEFKIKEMDINSLNALLTRLNEANAALEGVDPQTRAARKREERAGAVSAAR